MTITYLAIEAMRSFPWCKFPSLHFHHPISRKCFGRYLQPVVKLHHRAIVLLTQKFDSIDQFSVTIDYSRPANYPLSFDGLSVVQRMKKSVAHSALEQNGLWFVPHKIDRLFSNNSNDDAHKPTPNFCKWIARWFADQVVIHHQMCWQQVFLNFVVQKQAEHLWWNFADSIHQVLFGKQQTIEIQHSKRWPVTFFMFIVSPCPVNVCDFYSFPPFSTKFVIVVCSRHALTHSRTGTSVKLTRPNWHFGAKNQHR